MNRVFAFYAAALVVLLVCGCAYSQAKPQRLQTPIEDTFLAADYELIYRTSDIPAGVRELLDCSPTISCRMAEIGEPFDLTDLIDPRLPTRKLRFAGLSRSSVFVLFVQGGFAPSAHLVIALLDSGRVTKSAEFDVTAYADSIDDLKRLVPNGLRPVVSFYSVPPNTASRPARSQ